MKWWHNVYISLCQRKNKVLFTERGRQCQENFQNYYSPLILIRIATKKIIWKAIWLFQSNSLEHDTGSEQETSQATECAFLSFRD